MPSRDPYLTHHPQVRRRDGREGGQRYDSFCRQDLIGADYGLLDCATAEPLPDYAALLWTKTMGRMASTSTRRAAAADDGGAATIRLYAHCRHR